MKYKIIDNFLNNDDFNQLCSLKLEKISSKKIRVYNNRIFKNGSIDNSCLGEELIKKMHQNYHNVALNLLKELNPKKIPLYEYSDFHIIETGSSYKYPIHRDTPKKLLSGVIYLMPKENSGTFIYSNKKGDNKTQIEWKQNRGFFFSRTENTSYHSYEGNNQDNRIALIYNLMTNNLKGVCEVENISYYKVIAREFLNPYLYRFFRFVL